MADVDLRVRLDAAGLETEARRLGVALDRTAAGADRVGRSTDKAGGAFERFKVQSLNLHTALSALGIAFGTREVVRWGVDAVRTAARMETLAAGLAAVSDSAEQAAEHMRELDRIGRLPGIAFEEAVRAAQRMRAVGIEVQVVNRVLREFSNAVALSGGGRAQLDATIVQLTQMASAGRILTADLRPLIQQAPVLGRALRDAFGTIDAQEIEDLGLTFDEFITTWLDALSRLERAQGTAQTTFENFGGALKQLSAEIGDLVLPPLTAVANAITDILEAAEEASERSRRLGPTSGGLGILAQQEMDRIRRARAAAASNIATGAVDPTLIARVTMAFNEQAEAARKAAEAEAAAKAEAEAAAKAHAEAARAQAELVRQIRLAHDLRVLTTQEMLEAIRLEDQLSLAIQQGNLTRERRIQLMQQINELSGVTRFPLGEIRRPGVVDTTAGVRGAPSGPAFVDAGRLVGQSAAQTLKDEAPAIGEQYGSEIGAALRGVLAGVGTQIGGPGGAAVAGAGAGLTMTPTGGLAFDPVSALIGAGVGFLTSALGELFGAGGAAEQAAAQAERARLAWEQALDTLAELASPSGPLARAAEQAREAADAALKTAGIQGGLDQVLEQRARAQEELDRLLAGIEARRAVDPGFRVTDEIQAQIDALNERIEKATEAAKAYEEAIAGIAQRHSEDLEIRALEAQGLEAAAAARRLEIDHAREMADVEALVAAGADEALIAQTQYVHELEAAALAAAQAAQAERDRLSFLERAAELAGDAVGATRIRAEIQAAEDIRNAEALLAQGIIDAEQFAEFLELVTGSVQKAVEEIERARALQAAAFEADVSARFAEVTGDQAEADRIRREFAAAEELARAQELAEAGIITQEALAALADVLELELAKAAEEAAAAAREAAEAQERAAQAALEDLEVRRLVALGRDQEAEAMRFELEQRRELERAIAEGASEEFLRKLQEVQELEREAFERAARGAGRAVAAAADEGADTVARNIQAITTDQAITIVHVLRTHTGHLSEIALNTRSLRGAGLGGRAPAAAGAARGGGATINIQLHGISDPRQFAERLIVLLRTDPRLRRELDAAQAISLAEATEAAGMTGRGG